MDPNNNKSNPETRTLFARAMLRQLCCVPQATSSPAITTTRATVSTTTTTEVVEWDLDRVRWLVLQPPTAIMHALDLSFLEATALLGEAASVIAPLRRALSDDGGAAAGGSTDVADGWGKGTHPLEEWANRGPGSLFSMSDSGDVDSMLGGGLPHGFLVELVGRAGCGKSILLMSQVARSLARHYARRWVGSRFASHSRTSAWQQQHQQQYTTGGSPRCVWIDADGDFNAAVMEKLLRAFAVRELMTLLPPLLLRESGLTEEHEEEDDSSFADVEEEVEAAHQLVVDVAMEQIVVVQKVRTVLDFQAFLPTLAEFWTTSDAVAHPHRRHVPTQPTQRVGPAAATTTASSTASQQVPLPQPPPTPLPRPVKREKDTSAAAVTKALNDAPTPTPNLHHRSEPPPLLSAANRGVLVIDSFANLVRREYRGHPLETFERHDTVLSLMTSLKQLAAEQKLLVWMINHLPDGASHLSRRNATLGEPQHDDAFEESDPETHEGPGESRRSSTSSNRFAPMTKRGTKTSHHQGGGGARAGLGVTFFHAVNVRFQIQEAVVGGEEGGRWVPLLRVIKSSLGPPMVFQLTAWHAGDTQRLVHAMVAAAATTNGSSEGSPPGATVPHSVSSVDRSSRGAGEGGGGGGVIAVDVEWASPDVLRETFGWSSHSSVSSPSFAGGNVSMMTRGSTEQQQRPIKDRKRSRVPPELHCASMGTMMWQQSGTALDTFSYMRIPHFITQ